jgi:methylenetetrahydrofolate reductase (NADPH)
MKVIEHLEKANDPIISFEIIPPKRGGDLQQLLSVLDVLAKYNPPFIDITSHAAEVIYEETNSGDFRVKVKRKRPGTLGICALIQHKYNIDAVPHVICNGFTKEETEDFLIELHYLGISNLLAIKGDNSAFQKPVAYGRSINNYASDLVEQINAMNNGIYLEKELLDASPTNFSIGIAGYPEKHFEAPNLSTDLKFTKQKVDAGADYIVTQMFYDNSKFYQYTKLAKEIGIDVPIIPGIKILTSKKQLSSVPRNFYIDLPEDLIDEVMEADDKHTVDIGIEWAYRQVVDLLNNEVPAVHFYVMQRSTPIKKLMKKLGF